MNVVHIAAALSVALVLSATHWKAYVTGSNAVRAEWNVERAALAERARSAEAAARAIELEMAQAKHEAEVRYEETRKRLAADAAAARTELDRLRRTLAAPAPRRDPAPADPAPLPAVDGGPGIESQLLGQCAEALVGVASSADRLAAQVLGLQSYITNVCLKGN
jgi:hypothetical protein